MNPNNIPKIPIPSFLRQKVLTRALWDTLRTQLSYDEALTVKASVESSVDEIMRQAVAKAKASSL